MKNQWGKIAQKEKRIQDIRNRILNPVLLDMVKSYVKPESKVFDYGSGWGEFADILAKKKFDVSAYDDADEMVTNAKQKFKKPVFYYKKDFLKKLPKFKNGFDLLVSNLVLCILQPDQQHEMLQNIRKMMKTDGVFLLSFCHPCLDFISESVLSRRIRPYSIKTRYDKTFKYRKIIHENKIEFDDYHRPLEYYTHLFAREGFQIVTIRESDTLSTKNYPDFIVFVLKKK